MISQIGIGLLGAVAVFLSQHELINYRRWACIFGLLAQPFWFYTTYQAEQWGIFAVSFLYTYSWWVGFKTHWLQEIKQ